MAMDQRVSLITLGVDDLHRARAFYERLGWSGQEVEETVFFQAGGQAVVLWAREKVAADCGVADHGNARFSGIVPRHNVDSVESVDRARSRDAEAAGAEVTKRPAATFYGGYAGFFRDLDGHVWEISHNPGFHLGDDGTLTIPDFGTTA